MSEIYKALFMVQGVIRGVKKDSKNPHFKNSYASLEAVEDTIRPHMQAAGLVWFQMPGKVIDGSIEVTTVIAHAESGEEIRGTMEMPLAKRDPQGAGSALTYAQRYSLMAILGLPPTDDDAETAIDRVGSRPPVEAPEPPTKSSAQLKREGAWEKVSSELEDELLDCHSLMALERLKARYNERATADGWNASFKAPLRDIFIRHENKLIADNERSEADADFPGDVPLTNAEIRNHPMNAG